MSQVPALPVDGLGLDFRDLTDERAQRIAIYGLLRKILSTQENWFMSLQEQIATLTGIVKSVKDKQEAQGVKLGELQTSVDAEQEQVQGAIGLLTQDNPDIAAAITTLQSVDANLGTASDTIDSIKTDVQSTIPDAPPPVEETTV